MQFTDAVTVAGTRRTEDGYLVAEARAVRTGIQIYLGDEVGKPEMAQVRVYRPPEEVFSDQALQSFTHAPVTIEHPKDPVTSVNWKDLAVGEVSTMAKRDGEWVWLPLILKDARGIQRVEDGKRELSAGYSCEVDFTPGVTPAGDSYDAVQRNIKINHLAIVDAARAGSQARIGDGAEKWGASPVNDATPEKEPHMTLKTVIVDGIPIEVTDQGATVIATLQQRLADASITSAKVLTDHAAALADKDKQLATKDAEIDTLKTKIVDGAALDKMVADRAILLDVARKIAKDVKLDGLDADGIRKAVVFAKLGDAAVKDKSADYINARFDHLVDDAGKSPATDTFRNAVRDGITTTTDAAAIDKAHTGMVDHLTSAWQNPAGKVA